MPWDISFISKNDFKEHVRNTIDKYGETLQGIDLQGFNKNIIDPIKLTFDAKVYGKSIEDVIRAELIRQRDKTNSNYIGYFHQNIFNYIEGANVPDQGFDVIYNDQSGNQWFIEMKNKWNTMNSSSSKNTFLTLQNQANINDNYKCALVEIISKESQDIKWEKKVDGVKYSNSRIRRMSIDKFYMLVTGERDAFKKIIEVLPDIIDEIIQENDDYQVQYDTVIDELRSRCGEVLKGLYSIAFESYEGFND